MRDFLDIEATLRHRKLTDMLVAGFVDETNSIRRFHPMFEDVYFDFDGLLLRASSVGQYSQLRLSLVDRIECNFDIEEDDEFCVCPLDFVLKYPEGDYFLAEAKFFADPESTSRGTSLQSAALRFECRGVETLTETIFIDPAHIFGIKLGGEVELAAMHPEHRWRCETLQRPG